MSGIKKFNMCTIDEQFFLNWKGLAPTNLRIIRKGKVFLPRKQNPQTEDDVNRLESEFVNRYDPRARMGIRNYLNEYFRLI